MAKALLINPENNSITPIDIDLDPSIALEKIRLALSCLQPIETPLANGDALIFDQKGFQDTENLAFNLSGKGEFFGKVIVVGESWKDPFTDLNDLETKINFCGKGGSDLLRTVNKKSTKSSVYIFFQH